MKAWNYSWFLALMFWAGCAAYTVTPDPHSNRGPKGNPGLADNPQVRSIQFSRADMQGVPPIFMLNNQVPCSLHFDLLLPADVSEPSLEVHIDAFDANWQPTGENTITFYSGFLPDPISTVHRFANNALPYAHYIYVLPADGYLFKESGNYLLSVALRHHADSVLFQQPFVMVEPKVSVQGQVALASWVQDRRQKQRLDFWVNLAGYGEALDPLNDIQCTVLKNGRWMDAQHGIRARFLNNQVLEFIVPPGEESGGGAEFRHIDLNALPRSKEKAKAGTDSIAVITVPMDQPNHKLRPALAPDQNGSFSTGGFGINQPFLESPYYMVRFQLATPSPYQAGSVHVLGEFNQWTPTAENELIYDAARGRYSGQLLLKMGAYDYAYAVRKPGGELDFTAIEGDFSGTQNLYTILVYAKAPHETRHRCIGITQVDTR